MNGAQPVSPKEAPQLQTSSPATQQLPAALQNSLEHMSDALLTLDKDWQSTYLNKKAATLLCHGPKELLGKCIWSVIPELVNTPFYQALHKALKTQKHSVQTIYVQPLNCWLESRIHPSAEGVMVYFSDVSEQKDAEFRQGLIPIQGLQTAVDDYAIVSLMDPQGRIIWVNNNFCKLCHFQPQELIGKTHGILNNAFMTPEDAQPILDSVNKGQINKGEIQIRTKDGRDLWVHATIVPVKNSAGDISHHIVFCLDITERKQAEKALADSERLYRSLIENYSDAVFLTDWQGNIFKVNQQAETVTNLKQSAILRKNFLDFLPAEDRQKVSTALPMLMKGKDLHFKTVIDYFSNPFTAKIALVPILQHNAPSYFFVRLKDISSEVSYERDLKLLNDITLSLSNACTIKEGINLVMAQLCAHTDAQYAECWMPLYRQPLVRLKSAWWASEKYRPMQTAAEDNIYDLRIDRPEILSNQEYFFAGDLDHYKNFRRKPEAAASGLNSLLSIPITYRSQLLAVFNLFSATKGTNPNVDPDRLKRLLNKLGGELERRKANEELDRFFDLSPELMSIIGFDGYTKKYNPAFQELFGYSPEEISTMLIHDYVHPDDLPVVNEAWSRIIQGQSQKNIEIRYRNKSGNYRWLSCSTQSVVEENLFYLTARDITSQKQQFTELEQIRLAIENTTDGIGMASDMNHTIYVNKALNKLLGWTLEELNMLGWTKMFVNSRLPYTIVDILKEKGSWEGDIEMYHREGHVLDINLRANAVLQNDGTPRYLIGVYRDVTEQKQQLQELAKLSTAIKHSINEVYIITPENGHFTYVNARALNNLGYTQAEIGTLGPIKINPEYASFAYRKMFALLISGHKKTLHFQTYHTRKDGSRYPVEIHLSPFQFREEHAIMASVIDITERQKAEEELRISNERYRLVSLATNDAIWDLDLAKQITYYGEAYRTLFGHEFADSFASMEVWADNIHPEDAERVIGNVYDVLITNSKEWVIEYRFRCADGSYKYIKDRGYVIYNNIGEAIRMTGAIADITNQKQNELLLQEFNAELERKVEEKTASLAQALRVMHEGERARIKTEESLQQSLLEKEVLIKEIHHRVKNNMAIISSLLSLQARQANNDELKTILKDSQSRIKSMALIHELLYQNQNLAKINFKNYIYELVSGIADSFHSLDKDITIQIEAEAAELNIVHAVPCALILNELITNAYKYAFTEKHRGCISIDYTRKENMHKLTIADNGHGLPPDFDIRKTKSLGMQLIGSLVRQIGGEMLIEHEKGTKFMFVWKE